MYRVLFLVEISFTAIILYTGHTTQLRHTNEGIFQGLPQNFNVMRYHSLIADGATFPNCLKITAKNDEAIIMAFEHITFPVLVCNIILNLF